MPRAALAWPRVSASPDLDQSPAARGLPRAAAEELFDAGFNLVGVLDVDRYNERVPPGWRSESLLPTARSVVILACAGRDFERALERAPEAREPRHPVDRFTQRVVGCAAAAMGDHATRAYFYFDRLSREGVRDRDGDFVDLIALGRAAGLGEPGRLRILLHPRYGPWLAIRALLLSELACEPTSPLVGFDPCGGCDGDCAQACRADAFSQGELGLQRCFEQRLRDPVCAQSCVARRACVIGPHHAYAPAMEAHYMRTSLRAVQSWRPNRL